MVLGPIPNRTARESNRLRPPFASESAIEQPAATRRLSQRARLCLGFVVANPALRHVSLWLSTVSDGSETTHFAQELWRLSPAVRLSDTRPKETNVRRI